MLSTFRIRDLRRPSTPPRPSLSGAARPDYDALVRITAPEYDTTISINPDAKLKYVDEDDGEVVTVGSSLELSQRLNEPLLPFTRKGHWRRRTTALPSETSVSAVHRVAPLHHIFEIDRRGNSVNVWREIEAQTTRAEQLQGPTSLEAVSNARSIGEVDQPPPFRQPTLQESNPVVAADSSVEDCGPLQSERLMPEDLEVHVDALDDESRIQDMLSYEKRFWDLGERPSISNIEGTYGLTYAGRPKEKVLYGIMSTESDVLKNKTLEGKRQAQSAGEKTRNRTTPGRHVAGSSSSVTPTYRWSLYNDGNNVLNNSIPGSSVPPALTSEGKRQAQAAGDKLRTRTNPMRHVKPSRSESGISKNRWPAYSGSRPLRFDDRLSSVTTPDAPEAAMEAKRRYDEDQPLLKIFETEMSKLSVGATKQETDEDVTASKQENNTPAIPLRPTSAQNDLAIAQSIDAFKYFTKTVKAFADITEKMGSELKDPLAKIASVLGCKTPEARALSDYLLQLALLERQKEMRDHVKRANASSQANTKTPTHDTAVTLSYGKEVMPKANSGIIDDGVYVNLKAPTLSAWNTIQVSSQDTQQEKRATSPVLKQKTDAKLRVEPSISNLLNPETNSGYVSGPSRTTDDVPDRISSYESWDEQDHAPNVTPKGVTHYTWQPFARPSYAAYQPPISYPLLSSYNPSSTSFYNTTSYPPINRTSHFSKAFGSTRTAQDCRRQLEALGLGQANGETFRNKLLEYEAGRVSEADIHFPNAAGNEGKALKDLPRFPPLPGMEALQPSRVPVLPEDGQHSTDGNASDFLPSNSSNSTQVIHRDEPGAYETSGDFFKRMTGVRTSRNKYNYGDEDDDLGRSTCCGDQPPINNLAPPQWHPENLTFFDEEGMQVSSTNASGSDMKPPISEPVAKPSESKTELEEFREKWLKEIIEEKYPTTSNTLAPPPRPGFLFSENGTMRRLPKVPAKLQPTPALQAPKASPMPRVYTPFNWEQRFAEQEKAKAAQAEAEAEAEAKAEQAKAKAAQDEAKAASWRADDRTVDCVKWLTELGFQGKATDGEMRLINIALAARGNLVDAIDMLDEEERAIQEMGGQPASW